MQEGAELRVQVDRLIWH